MTSNEDDGNPHARVRQLALKLQPVDAGKSHVQNKATRPVRPLAAQELLRRPRKVSERKPTDFSIPWMAARTKSSSSMTNTVGAFAGVIRAPRL
ncbi:MAG: hypothetical protein WCA20_05875 [Candidatus Sulfotelmatobacter sp.]